MTALRHVTVALVLAMTALATPPASALAEPTPIDDPIPEKPTPSALTLTLEEFASFPKTEPIPPPTDQRLVRWARINYLGELPDGSGRLYVNDLNGKLYLLGKSGGQPREYLDVGATFAPDFISGRGLGSGFGFAAFHPDFARNGKFYTVHTEWGDALTTKTPDLPPQPGVRFHGVITEWTATDPRAGTFSGTRREMLRLGFSGQIHGIQQIDFNPTARRGDPDFGLLYIAAGDGGRGVSSDDPQNLAVPHGKILRIDPFGTNGANGRYGIPAANPFTGRPGALGEIYALGMRDPHRFSWDPQAGNRMFLGHIGEHAIEAIYDVGAGDNLGWSEREGPFLFDKADRCNLYTLPDNDAEFGYTYPVAAYDHDPPPGHPCTSDSGHAVVGGFVYRGRQLPLLRGKYLFGDIVDGQVFFTVAAEMREQTGRRATIHKPLLADATGKRVTMQELAGHNRVDLRFGRDAAGELYVLSKANGKIWKVTKAAWALPDVVPSLRDDVVAAYDFEHPLPGDPAQEQDQGLSGTNIALVNGGAAMRVADRAYRGSKNALQTRQVEPATAGNDDWKAGIYGENGVPTLRAFNGVQGVTIMGWFKMLGTGPAPNSNTEDPADFFNAIGLAGVLSGNSQGHDVRALLELITVNGELRVVALARRVDGSSSQTFAANRPWQQILPKDRWVFLAATFDFDTATMKLYRNGRPLDGFNTVAGDPWGVEGDPEPDVTSATDPRGIKIGGSYPQNTREQNPCDCRMDGLMFLDRVASAGEIRAQYERLR
ncbi:PQQ-dependent sugar dehydrogenase [Nonomuraea sp. SYSU D8015]|uniref:PQQ-dependent sugar dehydrogenase n=1 Tax=Nonomuraea sp. SYSU D8015 TaxID=2593644 RepID=UPI001660A1BD|nr:PQQ-dependent sugar dehydrogenase [Nonomuraea sp. SYSU D8015]